VQGALEGAPLDGRSATGEELFHLAQTFTAFTSSTRAKNSKEGARAAASSSAFPAEEHSRNYWLRYPDRSKRQSFYSLSNLLLRGSRRREQTRKWYRRRSSKWNVFRRILPSRKVTFHRADQAKSQCKQQTYGIHNTSLLRVTCNHRDPCERNEVTTAPRSKNTRR